MTASNDKPKPQLWTEAPEVRTGPVATVAPVAALDKLYSYAVPPELAGGLRAGMRVEVPFGRTGKPRMGFCVSVSEQAWTMTLKPLLSVIDAEPLLSPTRLELGQWISQYYVAPLGKALEAMVPASVRRQSGFRRVRRFRLARALLARTPEPPQGLRLTPKRRAVLDHLRQSDGSATLDAMKAEGLASASALRALCEAG